MPFRYGCPEQVWVRVIHFKYEINPAIAAALFVCHHFMDYHDNCRVIDVSWELYEDENVCGSLFRGLQGKHGGRSLGIFQACFTGCRGAYSCAISSNCVFSHSRHGQCTSCLSPHGTKKTGVLTRDVVLRSVLCHAESHDAMFRELGDTCFSSV